MGEGLEPRTAEGVARLAVIDRLEILDTPDEELYRDAVLLAAQICGVPIGMISLVDRDRMWFKSKVGLSLSESSLEGAFCPEAILGSENMIVEDATQDPRFQYNELVVGGPKIRFYAGVPVMADSISVGTLCVMSGEPQTMSRIQIGALEALGRQVSAVLDQRLLTRDMAAQNRKLESAAAYADELSKKLLHSANRFANLFQGLPVACMTLDADGNVMEWNAKSTEVYGFEPWEVFGKCIFDLVVPPERLAEAHQSFKSRIATGEHSLPNEWCVLRKDGTSIWVLTNSVPLLDPGGKTIGMISSNIDITDRKTSEAALIYSNNLVEQQKRELQVANTRLEKLATTDGLTGLNNHRTFQEFLLTEFALVERNQRELSIILLDVDKFKSLNDEFGHPAGDSVLKQIADVLSRTARKSSLVARYGGEEFVIVLPDTGTKEAMVAAERLRKAVETADWTFRPVTASFGVASYSVSAADPADLVWRADQALYEAKANGRNRVVAYVESSKLSV
jgi:diguanylate cyclase (GGDEF)-like protein/PAS domain S-box-containing protein